MVKLTIKPGASPDYWNPRGNVISDRGWSQEGFIWDTDLRLFGDDPSPIFEYHLKPKEKFVPVILFHRHVEDRAVTAIYKKDVGFILRAGAYHLLGDLCVDRGYVPKPKYCADGRRIVPFVLFLPDAREQFLSIAAKCLDVGCDVLPGESVTVA